MKRFPVNMITCIKGLVAHQIITASAISVVVLMYAVGISMMMTKGGDVTSLLLYVNPVVLLAAMVLMGQYLYAYDNHIVNGRERVEWPQWKMWSFIAGLFFMVCEACIFPSFRSSSAGCKDPIRKEGHQACEV